MKTALVPAVRNLLKQAPEPASERSTQHQEIPFNNKKKTIQNANISFYKVQIHFFFSLFNQVQITLPTTSCSSITLLEMVSHGLLQKADINIPT